MSNGKFDIARELLLKWMACGERKLSYESIRKNCEYLEGDQKGSSSFL